MIGRKEELKTIERLYQSPKFEFLIMYGRRRVGKTTILQEFSGRHRTIFYSAQEKNDTLNLNDFSKTVQRFFDQTYIAPFQNWENAFEYIGHQAEKEKNAEKITLIIDEFPFLAEPNASIKNILQHLIDLRWKNSNLLLILCGSSVSFMVNDVMGYKSPLYGRTTATMEIRPFDYLDSADFFPHYSYEDKLISFGILGGIPRYLEAFDSNKSVEENIEDQIIRNGAFLNDEPIMLLRMELREPGVYNSILESVANGANRITEISDRIHEDKSKCSKYITTLQSIKLLEKKIPCGEPEKSRKGIYELADNYYRFWYRFVFTNKNYYDMLGNKEAAAEITDQISDYMGPVFEEICLQYMIRKAKQKKLPFVPYMIGKWWGNNKAIRQQDDVDILAINRNRTEAIFCECKFRNKAMPMEEYDNLLNATKAFPDISKYHLYFFSKGGYTTPVLERGRREGAKLLSLEDLFE